MKTLKNYIDSVVDKVLRESLEEKADEIINKIQSYISNGDPPIFIAIKSVQ